MIRNYRAVRVVASAIAEAADDIIDAYRERRVVYEPSITERLFGAIETKVNGLMTPASGFHLAVGGGIRMPIKWEAMSVLAGSRSAAHEQRFGADILVSIHNTSQEKYVRNNWASPYAVQQENSLMVAGVVRSP